MKAVATVDHDGSIVAAVEVDGLAGAQFQHLTEQDEDDDDRRRLDVDAGGRQP